MTKVAGDTAQLSLFDPADPLLNIHVRESTRARRLSIRICPVRGVEVVVPRHTARHRVSEFVRQHAAWIRATALDLAPAEAKRRLPRQLNLAAIGEVRAVQYRAGPEERVTVADDRRVLHLSGAVDNADACRDALCKWLRRKARAVLEPWLQRLARETGLSFGRIQIRGQRTRWGSCSNNGTISLNFALLFLRPELVRCLLVHELCHTRHMNHSRAFWRLVARHEPDWEQLEQGLSRAGSDVPAWIGALDVLPAEHEGNGAAVSL